MFNDILMYRVFIKYCVFSKNFHYLATSPSPALGFYWLYKKWSANKSDCSLRSLTKTSSSPTCRGCVAVNLEKTQFLMNTLYMLSFWCCVPSINNAAWMVEPATSLIKFFSSTIHIFAISLQWLLIYYMRQSWQFYCSICFHAHQFSFAKSSTSDISHERQKLL